MLTILVIFTFLASLSTTASAVLFYGASASDNIPLKCFAGFVGAMALVMWMYTAMAGYAWWVLVW